MISCTGYVRNGFGTDEMTVLSSGKTEYPVSGETCSSGYYGVVAMREELGHNLY